MSLGCHDVKVILTEAIQTIYEILLIYHNMTLLDTSYPRVHR